MPGHIALDNTKYRVVGLGTDLKLLLTPITSVNMDFSKLPFLTNMPKKNELNK